MSLILYDLPHSPFCLPIKRILQAWSVPFEIVDVPNWDRRAVIEASGGNYYAVPMLLHDGRAIYEGGADTQDIARHVDREFAGGRLFPVEHEGLHEILLQHLENNVEGATFRATDAFYLDSISDPVGRVMLLRHKERKFGRGCVSQWKADIEKLRVGAAEHFARFEAILRHAPWLLGAQPVYADFLLWGIIGNYIWNGWNELPGSMRALHAWYEKVKVFSA